MNLRGDVLKLAILRQCHVRRLVDLRAAFYQLATKVDELNDGTSQADGGDWIKHNERGDGDDGTGSSAVRAVWSSFPTRRSASRG